MATAGMSWDDLLAGHSTVPEAIAVWRRPLPDQPDPSRATAYQGALDALYRPGQPRAA